MGLHYVFHPLRSRRISPDRAEGRVSDMRAEWVSEGSCIKIGTQRLLVSKSCIEFHLTQHPFPNVDRLLEKPRNCTSGVFRFLGPIQNPCASRSDALACMLALA